MLKPAGAPLTDFPSAADESVPPAPIFAAVTAGPPKTVDN
jgi:hypothetical protein